RASVTYMSMLPQPTARHIQNLIHLSRCSSSVNCLPIALLPTVTYCECSSPVNYYCASKNDRHCGLRAATSIQLISKRLEIAARRPQ
ncbi:MAG: hypothetical protein SNH16_05300, partial [Rikenellaceae bacterium]